MAIPKKSPHSGLSNRGVGTMGAAAEMLGKMMPADKKEEAAPTAKESEPSPSPESSSERQKPAKASPKKSAPKQATVTIPAKKSKKAASGKRDEKEPREAAEPSPPEPVTPVLQKVVTSPAAAKAPIIAPAVGEQPAPLAQTICSDNSANEQMDNRTIARKREQMPEQTDKRAIEQMPGQMSNRTNGQLDNRANAQKDNRTNEQLDKRSETAAIPSYIPLSRSELKTIGLNEKQHRVLHAIYFQRPFKVSGKRRICPEIPYGTVRNSLRSLATKGWITSPRRTGSGADLKTTCKVDERRCMVLFGPTSILNDDQNVEDDLLVYGGHITEQMHNWAIGQMHPRTNAQMDIWTKEQLPGQMQTSNSSSSVLDKPTTPAGGAAASSSAEEATVAEVLDGPELRYWKSKGLRAGKVANWMRDYSVSFEDMILSLQHAAFDLVAKGEKDAQGNPIKCSKVWFHRRIEREGFYDRPEGFKTDADRRLEREQKRLAEERERLDTLRKAREERRKLQMELMCEEMLSDPESEMYKQCEARLTKFERQRGRKNPVAMELALKRAFNAIMEEEAKGESEGDAPE